MIGLWLEDGQLRLETNLPRPTPPDKLAKLADLDLDTFADRLMRA